MKKILIASLCSAFVLGACAFVNFQPNIAGSGILVSVQI